MKKVFFILVIILTSLRINAQYDTDLKLNILPIFLGGYGASIEQEVFLKFSIEPGFTTFDRITLKLDPSIPILKNPFREQHIYVNIFRNIEFASNQFVQFGTQFNLYSRFNFSEEFVTSFESVNGELPNTNKTFVTSILLGYKSKIADKWRLGFQLAYNLRNNTETQSAFSATIGYQLFETKAKNKEIFY